MKNLLFILFVLVGLTSCVKDEEYNTNISPYQNYDVTIDESQMNVPGFSNTTWVITQITYTNLISEERTDTLTFTVQNNYSFNST